MSKRAAVYARVSTERQGEGYSLVTQMEGCRKHITERGWTVVLDQDGRPIEITDRASGGTLDRPGLDRLRDLVADGMVDVVVVYDLDRLAREAGLVYLLEKEFKKRGIEIHYVQIHYDDTPSGNLFKQMRASIAEYEKALILERLRRGKRGKARQGQVVGSSCSPYGYRFAKDEDGRTVSFQIIDEEAAVLRMVFEWYVHGDGQDSPLSLYAIARRLSELRIPTWTDLRQTKHKKKKEWGVWDSSVVRNMLRKETYAGVWYYNRRENIGKNKRRRRPRKEWIPVEVPAIVSRELWEAAQERLVRNRNRTQPNPKYKYLLQSRLRCGQCGCALTSAAYRNNGRVYKYYRCRGNALDRGSDFAHCRCQMPSIRADVGDKVVWDHVAALLLDPRCFLQGLRARAEQAEEAVRPLKREIAMVEEMIEEPAGKVRKLLDDYLVDEFPREFLIRKRQELEQQKVSLQRRRSDLQSRLCEAVISDETMESLEDFCRQISEGLSHLTFKDKRRILELLSVEGVVERSQGRHTIEVSGYFPDSVLMVEETLKTMAGGENTRRTLRWPRGHCATCGSL